MRADAALVGDLKEILDTLNESLPQCDHKEWTAHIRDLMAKIPPSNTTKAS